MVTAQGLIEKFQFALQDKWGYIWGKWGQLWTEAQQKSATNEMAVKYGARWIGHRVADCSGLGFWAFKELGGYIFHGSNTIWNEYVTDRCDLVSPSKRLPHEALFPSKVRADGRPILPGDPVFLKKEENGRTNRHHIGYYVGNDTVIEARGTPYGVVTSPLSRWHETAHWLNVDYGNGMVFVKLPTLKNGASGEDVKKLQTLLKKNGASLTVDGKFGPATEEAVKRFQEAHGLKADGIVGSQTWEALGAASEAAPPETKPELISVDAATLKAAYTQAKAAADTLRTLIDTSNRR